MKIFIRTTTIAILVSILVIFTFFIASSFLKTEKPGFVSACIFSVLIMAIVTFKYPHTQWYLSSIIYLPILLLLLFVYKGEGMKFYLISTLTCILLTYLGSFLGAWLHSKKKNGLSLPLKTGLSVVGASLVIFLIVYLSGRNARLDKTLMAEMDTLFKADQYLIQQNKGQTLNSEELQAWNKKYHETDSANISKVADILSRYGWPGEEIIGWNGNSTLWAVIQHSTLENQEKYLPVMREAVKNGKARPAQLALLEDRILVRKGEEQIYGSQAQTDSLGVYKLCPIKDEQNVNKRRFSAGLGPLQWYAKQIGIEYSPQKTTE